MFYDKRYYPRTPVSVPAILHDSVQNGEICCMVRDVSEKGVCFEISAKEQYAGNLHTGDPVHFQFIDTYQYGKESETDILSDECTIRYVKAFGDYIRIGCYVVAEDFQKYAVRREVVSGCRKAATA